MCIVRIAELVGQLSNAVKAQNPDAPWQVFEDTSEFFDGACGAIDISSVWETLLRDVPMLKEACESVPNS